ncbi:MAG TPA: hypothetical protein VG146_03520 [Verrucomicrobiae bacterium]|nr:hypothetical protein [Verrucomicrobiae bacterium]
MPLNTSPRFNAIILARRLVGYVDSCLLRARNVLKIGRSIDAPKRQPLRLALEDCAACLIDPDDVLQNVCAHDLLRLMVAVLDPFDAAVLLLLYDGFRVNEIALALHVSHPAIARHRRKVAAAALKLGVSSKPSRLKP